MSSTISRRGFVRGIGATAAGGYALNSRRGPVGDAEAIAPVVLYGAAVGASAVAGWAVREYEVIGSNPPAEGLTAGALKQDVYETARTRKSTNASTFVDNRNIINSGLENTLYVDGKVAAIEKLNQQATQQEVQDAALNAMKSHATTVERNLLKSWNESINEFESLRSTVESHSELTDSYISTDNDNFVGISTNSVTLTDGSTFDLRGYDRGGAQTYHIDPTSTHTADNEGRAIEVTLNGNTVSYLRNGEWTTMYNDLKSAISNVETGLQNWTSTVYEDVQSGDVNVEELITPKERAEMMAEEGAAAQAIADLQALNMPIAAGQEVTISIDKNGATLRGTLALSSEGQTIESGTTYDPSASTFDGDAYLTYDVATGEGVWQDFNQGVDGGIATFTAKPYEETVYSITTEAGETVEVTKDEFTPVDGSGNEITDPTVEPSAWEVDLSGKLDTAITNIVDVIYYANTDKTKIETIPLESRFTVESIEDKQTGESKNSLEFSNAEAQDDTNYITQEEWDQLEQQNKELIEKYEQSQNTGGGGVDLGQFDAFGLPGELLAGGVAIVLGVFGIAATQ